MAKIIQHPSSGLAIFNEMARAESLSQLRNSIGRITTIKFHRDHLELGFRALDTGLDAVCPTPKETFETAYMLAEKFAQSAPQKFAVSIWQHAFNFMASRSTHHEAVEKFMMIAEKIGAVHQPR
ncbi:MAG: hypothetical protein RBR86_07775 [Pseudobdellovibrionaceae bacterium]|jgi:hypothetical protein|nr:hypothetical protein [Pseudobdellovibrionaceae bacterium]